jgi:hypothetical protein
MLQLTGAAFAATVGTGYTVAGNRFRSFQESDEPIEFENSEELLLDAAMLPGDGWTEQELVEDGALDVSVTFRREFDSGSEGGGDGGEGGADSGANDGGEGEANAEATGGEDSYWLAISAAAGRDTESAATELYEELDAAFRNQVGEARTMDLDLASEGAIAGYDGRTEAVFRDVNCVGYVGFADCTRLVGCASHVGQTEELARAKRHSWRGGSTDTGNGGEQTSSDEQSEVEYVDDVQGQVGLAYGETAHVSNGVQTTVYEGTLYDQMGSEVPEDRDRFLAVPVEAENTSDEPRTIPDQIDSWEVLFGDQQLDNVFRYGALRGEDLQAFEGGDVQAGVRREGVLLFEVDEGFETNEFDVLWQDSYGVAADLEGDIDVRWGARG